MGCFLHSMAIEGEAVVCARPCLSNLADLHNLKYSSFLLITRDCVAKNGSKPAGGHSERVPAGALQRIGQA